MRRLPIYFLLDVSESMCGSPHEQLQIALQSIVADLRRDPQALETVHISVVAFAGRAKTLVPLTEITAFVPPELPLGGGTALGCALQHLFQSFDRDLKKPSTTQKGDWKPLVFLLTDGHPTDDVSPALKVWNDKYRRLCRLVAVSIGGQADHSLLHRLTEEVVAFDPSAPASYTRFAKWVSRSIAVSSQAVERGVEVSVAENKGISSEDPIRLIKNNSSATTPVDERFVFLIGRCSHSKKPYILKFGRELRSKRYECEFSGALPEDYFNFTEGDSAAVVNTKALGEAPCCPACESKFSINLCRCGRMHCSNIEKGYHICPWCSKRDYYAPNHFDIVRGAG
jgi:uncharacterized protein YegL